MKILVSHYTLQDKSLLASKWTKLFIGSPNSVFLDWNWISAWLNSIPSTPIVIEAKINEQSVGLGLLCSNTKRILFNTFEIKQLWLHKYGDDEIDQTWIEHNDFLLDSSYEDATREAILSYIKTQFGRWHEFYLGMSQTSIQKKFEDVLGSPRTLVSSADFSVNLEEMHDVNDYLSSLSKNTRSQINRSKKLLAQLGTVTLARAKTTQDKQVYFKKLSQLHQQKWRHTDLGSGFDNPVFVNFHKALILDDINNSYTNIFALELNGDALALVYLLKTNHGWYFYLSGIQTHPDNKIKIGLLTHTLVIEQAIIHGVKKYSFLAGDARYKQSMSNISEEYQSLVCFSKSSGLLKLIEKLRQIKHIMTHSSTD
ncbi:GNAT family N-acetyltransferase [Paraglaciecola aquimarina]|uniref:GNAT family N-acetyltransferase n=1 Tax=Paraglaciecola algarum TaxID=3050085 RepID=A0ABS9D7E4_9ALTE|nr:GNAT family N-acetyltransferase [Paraglaciecola sp. G1-23]MCF2947739.1 GNAT family N-acetyltransferase [Paraglaciecola sp. G1-23]